MDSKQVVCKSEDRVIVKLPLSRTSFRFVAASELVPIISTMLPMSSDAVMIRLGHRVVEDALLIRKEVNDLLSSQLFMVSATTRRRGEVASNLLNYIGNYRCDIDGFLRYVQMSWYAMEYLPVETIANIASFLCGRVADIYNGKPYDKRTMLLGSRGFMAYIDDSMLKFLISTRYARVDRSGSLSISSLSKRSSSTKGEPSGKRGRLSRDAPP